jgi:hypothetical protein
VIDSFFSLFPIMHKRFVLFFLLLIFFLTGCSLEKRHYFKGFYVEKKEKSGLADKSGSQVDINPITVSADTGSVSASIILNNEYNPIAQDSLSKDSCDVMTFKNGVSLHVKVKEINESYVKYKLCDDETGKIKTIAKEKVKSIVYNNGSVEDSSRLKLSPEQITERQNAKNAKTLEKLTRTAFASGINSIIFSVIGTTMLIAAVYYSTPYDFVELLFLSFTPLLLAFIFGVIGIVAAIKALETIKSHPEYKDRKKKLRTSLWLSIIGIALLILIPIVYYYGRIISQYLGY